MLKKVINEYISSVWYKENSTGRTLLLKLLTPILILFSTLYRGIIIVRYYLYYKGVFKSFKINTPVIIIGNITVGGNGKTPVVMGLVKALQERGYNPGIVLRGYGVNQQNKNIILIDQHTLPSVCGDEAKMIYNNTRCPVIANSDRVAAANYLVSTLKCNVIISDDGLQHYRLMRDIEICVIDGVRQFGNKKLLPAGPLREPISRLKKVDYLLTKASDGHVLANDLDDGYKKFLFNIVSQGFVNLNSGQMYSIAQMSSNLLNAELHVFAGLGNNNNFTALLSVLFLPFNFSFSNNNINNFPDHYAYTKNDFKILNDSSNILLTTEKDAVKIAELKDEISNFNNIYYLKILADLPEEFLNNLLDDLKRLVQRND